MSEAIAAPAAAAKPAAQSTPAPSGDGKSAPLSTASGFDALDAKVAPKPKETPKTPDNAKDAPKDGQKPAEAKPDDKKPAEISTGPKALRERLETVEREKGEIAKKVADYEKRIADFEAKGKDTTALAEKLAAIEKERDEYAAKVRAMNIAESPEFKAKYDKPFDAAAERAKKFITQLDVLSEDGTVERKAEWKDFAKIFNLDYSAAKQVAKQLFGEDEVGNVMGEWKQLHDLHDIRATALDEEQAQAQERSKTEIAERSKKVEYFQSSFRAVTEDIRGKNPAFQERPDDAEGNELLKEGYRLVDSAMLNGEALSPEQKIVMDAQIRHRAAAFTRMSRDIRAANERIAELEAELGEKRGAEPGKIKRGGEKAPPADKGLMDDLKESLQEA